MLKSLHLHLIKCILMLSSLMDFHRQFVSQLHLSKLSNKWEMHLHWTWNIPLYFIVINISMLKYHQNWIASLQVCEKRNEQ